MNSIKLQQQLFSQIKENLPGHLSLPDEIAGLLGVSNDSAYRRIRGEKALDINELELISKKYAVSFDALFQQQSGGYMFRGQFVSEADFKLKDWLSSMLMQLEMAYNGPAPEFIFQAKDIPLFHHFQIPELAMFKYFFWRKAIIQEPGFEKKMFSSKDREEDVIALGRKVHMAYQVLPSIEIWNAECINSTMNQIRYCQESGVFESEADAQVLYDQLLILLAHMEEEVAAGCKFMMGDTPKQSKGSYKVFVNEVMMGDNAIYASNGKMNVVYLNHCGINYIGTNDKDFCFKTYEAFSNIMKKSMLISDVGEKERSRFFKGMRKFIDDKRNS